MALEEWNVQTKRFVLYRSADQHSRDCDEYPYERIPRRVFLDTNVVNLLVKYSSWVFEHEAIPVTTEQTLAEDAEALMHVFYVGSFANWDVVASPATLEELSRTKKPDVRQALLDYGGGLVGIADEDRAFAVDFGRRMRDAPFAAALPQQDDRELVGNAIALQCDAFCTCDRRTIVSKRDKLTQIPMRILTPAEWWAHVKPWARLWC